MHRLAPGHFVGSMDARFETPCGVICLIGQQPRIEPHEHGDTHFVLILDGDYRTAARGIDDRVVGAGTVLHNPPGTRHDDQFVKPGKLMTYSVSDALSKAAAELRLGDTAWVVTDDAAKRLLVEIGAEARRWDATSVLSVGSLSYELLAALRPSVPKKKRAPRWLARVKERIDDACENTPTVEELAHEAGVHPVSFARAFRRHMGMSPRDWMLRARARRAAGMLANTRTALSEIALDCGFADQAAFTKGFARATGCPPGEFRRRWS